MRVFSEKEQETRAAACDPRWNWRGFKPLASGIFGAENPLPEVNRTFMRNLGAALHGEVIVYGGALNHLVSNQVPNDFDGYLLAPTHPLVTLRRMTRWARAEGYEVQRYKRRVELLWKRARIVTPDGIYDLGCLQAGPTARYAMARRLADEADISLCARSATADRAFISARCLDGAAQGALIFRPFLQARDAYRHFGRYYKYAVERYPNMPVAYQSKADAALMAPLQAARPAMIASRMAQQAGATAPFDISPLTPELLALHNRLKEAAKARLT